MPPVRRPGWEERLAMVLARYHDAPYRLGETDCVRLACEVHDALVGQPLWHLVAGSYDSRESALAVIARWGRTWSQAFTALFGVPPVAVAHARRGDIVTFDGGTDKHLGVCNGASVCIYVPEGLGAVPLTDPRLLEAWRIG
jgi:hypothetical protein